MKLAFSTSAVLIGALTLTASAQTQKPKQTTNPGGSFLGGGDDCAAPDVIAGQGAFAFDVTAATTGLEGQNEANCYKFGSSTVDADVWYSWTADATGTATMTMCGGATNDTKIAAYPGGGCPVDGSSLDCNDDTCGLQSEIVFPVTAATTYMLQVGTFPGGSVGAGTFNISIAGAPGGNADDCAAPEAIAGQGSFAFDQTAATTGLEGQNETNCYKFGSSAVDNDVWFSWTADALGDATVSTCVLSSGDTKIAAYPGGGCPVDGSSLDCNDDTCGLRSSITFSVTPGTTYMLQIGNFPGAAGLTGTFDITITPPAPPANDDCATPELISGEGTFAYDQLFSTTGTQGQNESNCYKFGSSAIDNDVWYEWTATGDGIATVSLCAGAGNDTKVAAYAGTGCPTDGTSLDCNDDTCGLASEISFPVTNGSVYTIQLGTFPGASQGAGSFDIDIFVPTLGTNFCTSSVNSTGGASLISATGSASISADDLVLHASNAPTSQSGLFYFGALEIALPFGNGTRCVAGSTWRMPVLFEAGGTYDYDVDMTAFGGLIGAIGTTKFQCWYRDPVGGGAAFNLSNGLSIDMVP